MEIIEYSDDYRAAVEVDGVRAIPTVILADDRRVVGTVPLLEYRRLLHL